MAFRAFSGQRNIRCALDLGCGAGAVALSLARHAEHVVATDINPRALVFLRCNAVLNDIDNVEAREGDLFLPIQGKTFDVIASQPPYVPKAAGLSSATYLFGGSRRNELVARLIDGLPEHLARDGRSLVVFEQARHPERTGVRRGSHSRETDADSAALWRRGGRRYLQPPSRLAAASRQRSRF
jgi:methylase of polypeptide subunit release factors